MIRDELSLHSGHKLIRHYIDCCGATGVGFVLAFVTPVALVDGLDEKKLLLLILLSELFGLWFPVLFHQPFGRPTWHRL
jgi:hypothetical protein